jgi:hypothetical protein
MLHVEEGLCNIQRDLLGYNAVYFIENQLTFRRNISFPSSWLRNKPSNKPESKQLASKQVSEEHIISIFRVKE